MLKNVTTLIHFPACREVVDAFLQRRQLAIDEYPFTWPHSQDRLRTLNPLAGSALPGWLAALPGWLAGWPELLNPKP